MLSGSQQTTKWKTGECWASKTGVVGVSANETSSPYGDSLKELRCRVFFGDCKVFLYLFTYTNTFMLFKYIINTNLLLTI